MHQAPTPYPLPLTPTRTPPRTQASTVVPVLMDFMGDANQTSAVDVVLFVREIVETYPQLRDVVMPKLLQTFPTIQASPHL